VVVLVHEQLDDLTAALPDIAGKVGSGWDAVVGKLDAILADTR
jgi:hypothetical protein